MKFYALSQKDGVGCPVGMLNSELFDKFYENTKDVNFGMFPWYSYNKYRGSPPPFPATACLISKDREYKFDLRRINSFSIASDRFIDICEKHGVPAIQKRPIRVCSTRGENRASQPYNACWFPTFSIDEAVIPGSAEFKLNPPYKTAKSLDFRPDLPSALFRLNELPPEKNTLFCNERFFESAEEMGVAGINFTPVSAIDWNKRISVSDLFEILGSKSVPWFTL